MFYKFLLLSNFSIAYEVTGKLINRGDGYSLEIPVKYEFNDQDKAITWIKKHLEKIMNDILKKIEYCVS